MIRQALLSSVALTSLIALVPACGAPQPAPEAAPAQAAQDAPASTTPAAPAAVEAPKPQAEAPKAEEPKKPQPVFTVKDAGFATPESVLHVAADDVYLVSNINGAPGAADNNGFISKVSPDGKLLELKWIAGGQKGVKLDAPKGMAVAGDTLYVADLTVVRMFELKTGKPKGEVKAPGATFLNDLVAGADGKIWATDTGIKLGDKGPEPTKSDSVWVIEKGKAKSVAKAEELAWPNGIAVVGGAAWVVSFGSGELYRVDDKGKRQDTQKLPKGNLDGIAAAGDTVLVSSWEASAIYRGKPGGTFEIAVADVKAPADIDFDAKRSRVLIPLFNDNAVVAYDIK